MLPPTSETPSYTETATYAKTWKKKNRVQLGFEIRNMKKSRNSNGVPNPTPVPLKVVITISDFFPSLRVSIRSKGKRHSGGPNQKNQRKMSITILQWRNSFLGFFFLNPLNFLVYPIIFKISIPLPVKVISRWFWNFWNMIFKKKISKWDF